MKRALVGAVLCLAVAPMTALADSLAIRQCKAYVQGRIDVLDAQLHKGRKPNEAQRLVKRRDRLKGQLEDCGRNPKAYKKNI